MAHQKKIEGLNTRQQGALAALMSTTTVREAAQVARVGERTLWRWLREPQFVAAYRAARQEATRQLTALLQHASGRAVRKLLELMDDQNVSGSVQASAARTILEFRYRGDEIETQEQLRELQRRFDELQAALMARAEMHMGRL